MAMSMQHVLAALGVCLLIPAVSRRARRPADVLHVYPPGWRGPKQEPSYTGLMAAYAGGPRRLERGLSA